MGTIGALQYRNRLDIDTIQSNEIMLTCIIVLVQRSEVWHIAEFIVC